MPPNQRAAALRMQGARRKSVPQSLTAPIKGWNTRDPFEEMDPLDAILLDNWYPDYAGVTARGGSVTYNSGIGGGGAPVQTLAPFDAGSLVRMVAAAGGALVEIGNAPQTSLATGFASDIWQFAVFNGHLFLVNGADPAQIYDGTTMAATGFTGATMSTMVGVGVFNNRLYFWDGIAAGFWYGPVLGIAGALNFFDLSMVTREGGSLVAVEVLSYDGGTGINNYTCFFMSSGEVMLYSGTDPSNASNWALVGRYVLPPIVARRSIVRYGGDVYLTTANDHQQLSKLLIALRLGETPARTKASGAVKAAYAVASGVAGWQALYYPAGTRILYNIPNGDGTFDQHVYNTATQAWCRFKGMNAYCFAVFRGNLFFGAANGVVKQADTGTTDDGAVIVLQSQQAWQLFDTPLKKRMVAVRPIVQSSHNGVAFSMQLGFDYREPDFTIPDSTVALNDNALIWGIGNWGAPLLWGGSGQPVVVDSRWHIAAGEGAAIGVSLNASASASAIWVRTDLMIEPGNAL